MEWHDRCLADAEHVKRQQDARDGRRYLALEYSAGDEVERPRNGPGADDRDQLQADGCPEKNAEIDPAGASRLVRTCMCNKGKGRYRQNFIEDEQGHHVAGERDADGRCDGDREEGVESRLVDLAMTSHVADGVDRRDNPQAAGEKGEHQAERFGGKPDRKARKRFGQNHGACLACVQGEGDRSDGCEQDDACRQTHELAQVGQMSRERDTDDGNKRDRNGGGHERARVRGPDHGMTPRPRAALSASPIVRSVATPKTTHIAVRISVGTRSIGGASSGPSTSAGGAAK